MVFEINNKRRLDRYDNLIAIIDLLDGRFLVYEAGKYRKTGDLRLSLIDKFGGIHFEATQAIDPDHSSEEIIRHLNKRYLHVFDKIQG